MRTSRRIAGAALTVTGVIVLTALPAAAHVEAEPNRVKPGKEATVEFITEHGCDGESPTIEMVFRVPRDVTDAAPVEQDGWTSSVEGRRVVFTGGSAPADKPAGFSISFTAPDEKTDLLWKVVQRCDEGVDRWIQNDAGADRPAPRVGVGQKPATGDEHEEEDEH